MSVKTKHNILNDNQYPPTFYEPITREKLTKIVQKDIVTENEDSNVDQSDTFLKFRDNRKYTGRGPEVGNTCATSATLE